MSEQVSNIVLVGVSGTGNTGELAYFSGPGTLVGVPNSVGINPSRGNGNNIASVALGYQALSANTTGVGNTAIGYQAMAANTTGGTVGNVAIGNQAMVSNISGDANTALGIEALFTNTTGSYNTAVGADAIGFGDGGNHNVAIGPQALFHAGAGSFNTSCGALSLNTTTGSGNVGLGYCAGFYEVGSNVFYVDNQDRLNTAGDKAGALLYGTFNATASLQTLRINATLGVGVGAPSGTRMQVGGPITASAGLALTLSVGGNLTAAANGDQLIGFRFGPGFTPGAFTGLQFTAVLLSANSVAAFASPADPLMLDIGVLTGNGAANAWGIRIAPPVGAANNYLISHTTPGMFSVLASGLLTATGVTLAAGSSLTLGNAYVAGVTVPTGSIVIKDSNGQAYRVSAVI